MMTRVNIPISDRAYEVHIGSGLLKNCGELLAPIIGDGKAVIITDSKVAELYLSVVAKSLSDCGIGFVSLSFPAGEKSKNMRTLTTLLEFMASRRVNRDDVVLALGGGVTGDMAGLAAALYMRGISLVQLPTTLLAMVDSSVGGKTAVDLAEGKNLVGAFHQPSAVLCDTDTLSTLSRAEIANGAAEAVKTGIIGDSRLFDLLSGGVRLETAEEIVTRCVSLKGKLVAEDERDTGARQLLNLGHTLGHAIEKLSGFTMSHACGVSAGLSIITCACVEKGYCSLDSGKRILSALKACGLPIKTEFSAGELFEATFSDKKRTASDIVLVLPEGIGSCRLKKTKDSELSELIELGLSSSLLKEI